MLVLIDTWWNVNKLMLAGVFPDALVLIDTWWNVNCFENLLIFMENIKKRWMSLMQFQVKTMIK